MRPVPTPKKSHEPLLKSQGGISRDEAEKSEIVSEAEESEETNNQAINTTRVPKSPVLTLVSCSTTSNEDILWENSDAEEDDARLSSLEAQREQITKSFDPSRLDSWLEKQAQFQEDSQSTPQELVETQIWGHIDPQAIWPKEPSTEWLDQKREEIEARGGRKANFGKLLTQQVIKERKDNGWRTHQNKDVVDDEKSEDAARALQELFGIKDIDALEPGVRAGQLVMAEKAAVDEEGLKKPAVYLVG